MHATDWLRAAALAGLCLASGCSSGAGAPEFDAALAGGARERKAPIVRAAPLERRAMTQWLETTAVVESEGAVDVLPKAAGIVVEIAVEEGDRVESGALLARLERRDQELAVRDAQVAVQEARGALAQSGLAVSDAESRLESARESAAQAERDYQRDLRLTEDAEGPAMLSDKALESSKLARDKARHDVTVAALALDKAGLDRDAAATALERAELTLQKSELALSHTDVRAPAAGVVARRTIKLGDSASPAKAAFALTDPDALRVVLWRPQRELALFARADRAGGALPAGAAATDGEVGALGLVATAEALPGASFEGRILRVSPTVDPASGSFAVTASLSPRSASPGRARLLPGMLVRLRIPTDVHADALVAPKRALVREGDTAALWLVRDGRVERVPVTEGYQDAEASEVLPQGGQALAAGELVVVVGGRDLEHGDSVSLEERAESDAATPEATPQQPAPTETAEAADAAADPAARAGANGAAGG
jgi:membrane fusion protein (multidrug efflux system)